VAAVHRVLPKRAFADLDAYRAAGGGRGLDAARARPRQHSIEIVTASGLRGRGGAGFPTGTKWATVATNMSPAAASTVVVNAAEGEPGSFKDRALLRANPYATLEGALIAAHAVGANEVIVALKASFRVEAERVASAIGELRHEGWHHDVSMSIFEGPDEYLYGEETALLEVIDGRQPLPRVAPPFRRGVVEVVDSDGGDDPESSSPAEVQMAGPTVGTIAPPTLVNNVETLANVPIVLADGPEAFRSLGTEGSPGTIVCTVTGRTRRHGVAELPMGTPLREVIATIGGGPEAGRHLVAALSGVANPFVPEQLFDTPVSYEGMDGIGAGPGTGGFIVFDDQSDLVAAAASASRFLAVESCGQCTACKQDGLLVARYLARLEQSRLIEEELEDLSARLETITTGARCSLAAQHQLVVESLFDLFPEHVQQHLDERYVAARHEPILPIVDIVDGRAVLDEGHLRKQPDWTYDPVDSGQSPADRVGDHRAAI